MVQDGRGVVRLVPVVAMIAGLAVLSAATVADPVPDRAQGAVDRPATEPIRGPAPETAGGRASTPTTGVASGRSASPTTGAATTTVARQRLVIHGVGDTNFDPGYIPALAANGYDHAFDGLGGLFERDDLTVINLECAPSDLGQRVPKTFSFRCDPAALPIAKDNGVEVANLANNHSIDYGIEAMLDGRDNLEAAGIAAVGVGADVADATTPALLDLGGWRVAVLGMGGVVPADWWLATDDRPGMASGDDIEQMAAAVRRAAAEADLVVVSIHWGRELVVEPDPDDRARAEAMVEAGADIVFGHHSHRLGAVELIDGRPVFWTLGNFVWPRLSDAGATTAVARVVVEPSGELTACLIPAFIASPGQPELTGPPPCGPGAPGGTGGAQNRVS